MNKRNVILILLMLLVLLNCTRKSTQPYEDGNNATQFVTCIQTDIVWPSLADSPWPMFHHDPQHTGRSQYTGPQQGDVEWLADPLEGSKLTTLVYIGEEGELYYIISDFTNGDRLVSLDTDGNVRWELSFPNKGRVGSRNAIIGSGNIIYISCNNGRFYGISAEGSVLSDVENGVFLLTLNIGIDGSFYGTDESGTLYALDSNGNIVWTTIEDQGFSYVDDPMFSPDGSVLYVTGADSGIYALSTSGDRIWYNSIDRRRSRWCYMVDNQGHIYVNPDGGLPGVLYCLNQDGTLRWKYQYAEYPSPYGMTMDHNGYIYLIDESVKRVVSLDYDGQFRWGCDYPAGVERYGKSQLTCDSDGNIYVINSDTQPSAFSVSSSGAINWIQNLSIGPIRTDCQPTISHENQLLFTADMQKVIVSLK